MKKLLKTIRTNAPHFTDYVCGIKETAFAKKPVAAAAPTTTTPQYIQNRRIKSAHLNVDPIARHDDIMQFVRLVQKNNLNKPRS